MQVSFKDRYLNFKGRFGLGDKWLALGFSLFLSITFLGSLALASNVDQVPRPLGILLLLVVVISAITWVIVGVASCVKRLHDFNVSGWWYLAVLLLYCIPFLGLIPFVGMHFIRGTVGTNRYGDDPHTRPPRLGPGSHLRAQN
jgi:uncharacterized membrane protein YhaH (DUF805 family)